MTTPKHPSERAAERLDPDLLRAQHYSRLGPTCIFYTSPSWCIQAGSCRTLSLTPSYAQEVLGEHPKGWDAPSVCHTGSLQVAFIPSRACPQPWSCITKEGRRIHFQHFIILINKKKLTETGGADLGTKHVLGPSTGWGKWDFWIYPKSLTPPNQSLIPRKCPATWIIAA